MFLYQCYTIQDSIWYHDKICYYSKELLSNQCYTTQNIQWLIQQIVCNVAWLFLTSHRQRGHLKTAHPFTVPCEGREARLLHLPGIEPRVVVWQSITKPLRHASSSLQCINPANSVIWAGDLWSMNRNAKHYIKLSVPVLYFLRVNTKWVSINEMWLLLL